MTNANLTSADLSALTKAQLLAMVHARGAALVAFINADNRVAERMFHGTLTGDDMRLADEAKKAALLELGERESSILFGAAGGSLRN